MEAGGVDELVLVDNGSTDGSAAYMREHYSGRARILEAIGARVGQVRNVGAVGVRSDILAFIDSDCVIGPDYFTVMRRVFANRQIEATGATYALPTEPRWIERTWDALHAARPRGVAPWINAGNFAIRREVFEELGGFDADLRSGEDTQLGARLCDRGYVIYEEPDLRAVHLGNPKTVRGFFRKHVWHGMGILGTPGARRLVRRPLAMLILHVLLNVLAVAWVIIRPPSPLTGLAALLGALLAVPAFTVLYRWVSSRRTCNVAEAVFLYSVYYAARVVALAKLSAALIDKPATPNLTETTRGGHA
jgi:glycosyltransferase involved in cell wall biosynthesis